MPERTVFDSLLALLVLLPLWFYRFSSCLLCCIGSPPLTPFAPGLTGPVPACGKIAV
jgi:hypothetical protein